MYCDAALLQNMVLDVYGPSPYADAAHRPYGFIMGGDGSVLAANLVYIIVVTGLPLPKQTEECSRKLARSVRFATSKRHMHVPDSDQPTWSARYGLGTCEMENPQGCLRGTCTTECS
jgi:hypothetical protein